MIYCFEINKMQMKILALMFTQIAFGQTNPNPSADGQATSPDVARAPDGPNPAQPPATAFIVTIVPSNAGTVVPIINQTPTQVQPEAVPPTQGSDQGGVQTGAAGADAGANDAAPAPAPVPAPAPSSPPTQETGQGEAQATPAAEDTSASSTNGAAPDASEASQTVTTADSPSTTSDTQPTETSGAHSGSNNARSTITNVTTGLESNASIIYPTLLAIILPLIMAIN
ncbi:hypothetical protein L0F63_005391 [Massospora cicadina]|nr:hypothetical protein L0F63_005391 [Massospora cicadina]